MISKRKMKRATFGMLMYEHKSVILRLSIKAECFTCLVDVWLDFVCRVCAVCVICS